MSIYLNLGRRRQGKTTLVAFMSRRVPRRLMFDPRGLMQFGTSVYGRSAFASAFQDLSDEERAEVVYTPDGDLQTEFVVFARYCRLWVTRHPDRPIAIVVDEAAFVDTDVEDFLWVLRCSDPSKHHVFVTAHRPSDVSTRMRAIADHWLLFATRQEHDLKVITERCGPAVSRNVGRLQAREFVHWDDAIGNSKHYKAGAAASWFVALGQAANRELPSSGLEEIDADDDDTEPGRLPLKPAI